MWKSHLNYLNGYTNSSSLFMQFFFKYRANFNRIDTLILILLINKTYLTFHFIKMIRATSPLCHACGHFIQENPLVRQGLVPDSLSDLFIPIFQKPPEKKRRIVTKSRILSGKISCLVFFNHFRDIIHTLKLFLLVFFFYLQST